MKDNYMWDGSGEPDPDVQRLEHLLDRYRHDRPAPDFPLPVRETRRFFPWPTWPHLVLTTAAAVLVIAGTVWIAVRPAVPGWDVARVEGKPRVGWRQMRDKGRLLVGQALATDAFSRARINVGAIGQVEVEPNSRVRLVRTSVTEHRLALDIGTIHVTIWAPPRLFYVVTPSAVAVDLGCAYTLTVDGSGAGLVRVTSGWVGFELSGRESFIPQSAACATRPGVGPGTPYFESGSEALKTALSRLDWERLGGEERATVLSTVLREARRQDAFTLWHLLFRLQGAEAARVYERMASLVPPPPGVTLEGVLAGDRDMLDRWWNDLGLGQTSWWRIWKRPFPQ